MNSKQEKADPFKELKWNDFQDWAGDKATAKGMKYQDEGRVEEIKFTPEGGLVARVRGNTAYFTEVFLESGKPACTCTCPVGHDCKHGVATVLEYLELIEQEEEVPVAAEGEPLLIMARQGKNSQTNPAMKIGKNLDPYQVFRIKLRDYLEGMEKEELIELLMNLSGRNSLLSKSLWDMLKLNSGDTEETITGIYLELEKVWQKVRDYDYTDYDSPLPDFSELRNRMESFLEAGYAEEVTDLGMRILEGFEDLAVCDEEGDFGMELGDCTKVIIKAFLQSKSPAHERMLRVLDLELKDEFGIFDSETFWNSDFPAREWSLFSEILKEKLDAFDNGKDLLYSNLDRDLLARRRSLALEKTGNYDEAISLCKEEAEAGEGWSHVRLIRVLLAAGKKEEAEEWVSRKITEIRKSDPETALKIYRILLETREKDKDWLYLAALRAEEFFRYPSVEYYTELRKAAKKAELWEKVREAVHAYLENGNLPVNRAEPEEEKEKASSLPGILPKTCLMDRNSFRIIDAPALDLLIDIAVEEVNPDEVARWYKALNIKGEWGGDRYFSRRDKIVRAVQDKYPEIAIEIWKSIAEELIARKKTDAYESASIYLRMVRNAMDAGGQKAGWESYLEEIREKNRLKRSLLGILDVLEKDRIIEG